ncbi:MAG: tetratricopeptide repeat protein, partial [Bacteroidales bacterium]|nr:tetratricopeptide repeat protein [Bacteroidales bacterium]
SKYPNDPTIKLSLIDAFNKLGKYEQAYKFLDQAIAEDPSNYNLYYVAGVTYLHDNNFEKAISNLTKAYQLNSSTFDTNYGLGAAYVNYGADLAQKANDIIDIAQYNAAIDEANEVFKKALPYMEAALNYQPDNVDVMNTLKELYFRLRQIDPSLTTKYNEINAKINAL